jgi:hypothetical protein
MSLSLSGEISGFIQIHRAAGYFHWQDVFF